MSGIVNDEKRSFGRGEITYRLSNLRKTPLLAWLAQPPHCSTQTFIGTKHESHRAIFSLHPAWGHIKLYEIGGWETLEVQWEVQRMVVQEDLVEDHADTSKLTDKELGIYLESSNQMQIDQDLRNLVASIIEQQENRRDQAVRLFEWIASNNEYHGPARQRGIQATLRDKGGDCGALSCLYCAMCRAAGIPARPIFGAWYVKGVNHAHVWSEIWLDKHGWIPVDVSLGQGLKSGRIKSDRATWQKFFGNAAGAYVAFSIGVDIAASPYADVHRRPAIGSRILGKWSIGSHKFYWGYDLPDNRIPFLQPAYPLYPDATNFTLLDGNPPPGYWSINANDLRGWTSFELLRRNVLMIAMALLAGILVTLGIGLKAFAYALIFVFLLLALSQFAVIWWYTRYRQGRRRG